LSPRVIGLDRLLTVDERPWLGRSANIDRALASGDLANTHQMVQPGVTVLWPWKFRCG